MDQFMSDVERIFDSAEGSAERNSGTLRRVARAAVPQVADFCLIFLADKTDIRCAAYAHATVEGQELLRRFNRIYKITRTDPLSTVAHVVRTGRPQLRRRIREEEPAHAGRVGVTKLHRRLETRSVIVVPIGAAPNVLGAMSFAYAQSGRRFTPQHLRLIQRLTSMTAAFLRRPERIGATRTAPPVPRRRLRLRVPPVRIAHQHKMTRPPAKQLGL